MALISGYSKFFPARNWQQFIYQIRYYMQVNTKYKNMHPKIYPWPISRSNYIQKFMFLYYIYFLKKFDFTQIWWVCSETIEHRISPYWAGGFLCLKSSQVLKELRHLYEKAITLLWDFLEFVSLMSCLMLAPVSSEENWKMIDDVPVVNWNCNMLCFIKWFLRIPVTATEYQLSLRWLLVVPWEH